MVRPVGDPFLHAQEVQQLLLVVHDLEHVEVVLQHRPHRRHHREDRAHEVARQRAVGIDQPVDVLRRQVAGPEIDEAVAEALLLLVAVEVDRRDGQDHVLDGVGLERGVAGREHAAFADAEQVHLVDAVPARDLGDRAGEVVVDIVVDRQPAVGAARVAPVDDIEVDAEPEEVAHQRPVLLQVRHGVAPDEPVDDQDRGPHLGFGERAVAVEGDLVLAPDLVLGRRRDRDVLVLDLAEELRAFGDPLAEIGDLAHRLGRVDRGSRSMGHGVASWRLPLRRLRATGRAGAAAGRSRLQGAQLAAQLGHGLVDVVELGPRRIAEHLAVVFGELALGEPEVGRGLEGLALRSSGTPPSAASRAASYSPSRPRAPASRARNSSFSAFSARPFSSLAKAPAARVQASSVTVLFSSVRRRSATQALNTARNLRSTFHKSDSRGPSAIFCSASSRSFVPRKPGFRIEDLGEHLGDERSLMGALPCIAFERFAETSVADDHSSPNALPAPPRTRPYRRTQPRPRPPRRRASSSAMSRNMPCCEARKALPPCPHRLASVAHALERVDLRHGQTVTTWRTTLPCARRSKPSLISSSRRCLLISRSTGSLPRR